MNAGSITMPFSITYDPLPSLVARSRTPILLPMKVRTSSSTWNTTSALRSCTKYIGSCRTSDSGSFAIVCKYSPLRITSFFLCGIDQSHCLTVRTRSCRVMSIPQTHQTHHLPHTHHVLVTEDHLRNGPVHR
jgi:hypothetical protein